MLPLLLGGIVSPLSAAWVSGEEAIMGTRIRAEVWHADEAQGQAAIASVMQEFRRLDRKLSPYIETSEIALVNRTAAAEPVPISAEFYRLLETSLGYSTLTQGAFDISFASIGHRYDYRKGIRPSSEQVELAISLIDYRHIRLVPDENAVSFKHAGVRIDLGGIAKGYAVDRGIALLEKRGIRHALISAGGDSRLLGDHKGRPWHIGIQAPRDKQAMAAVLPLADSAVSTSGDYERYFEHDGIRYHHIISPDTGRSADSLQSVTIIGPDATQTDALSTSIFVLGAEAGMALINRLEGFEAVIIDNQGRMSTSDGLANLGVGKKRKAANGFSTDTRSE
ncbi:MAG: FAD:protein FMN transferase [Candidatus Thiodiazotropha sp. (ex Dulcina madagascariensis)]|nr:FAD:protein FMN transferase [Candidatus Thiodiazotropha sp. (ex Dulcina madagascariensis)]MCU7927663.1 FAD:protein FMN transferase [Candidatus Thiodiazotropha sp. (ex Dulcina madagascariensis)]